MKKSFKFTIVILLFLAMLALVGIYIATHEIAVLNPKGMIAVKERKLMIIASLLMLIVVVPVFVLTLVFAWKYDEGNTKSKYTPDWEHSHLAECLWWGIPFVIIIALAILTWKSSHELDPYRPIESDKKPIEIQAVALDWKWLFIYPELGIATVNFVRFPEKTPVNFLITADAPMNSLWIPQLGGQIYAMPAMKTQLHLIADEVGSFRGCSANISGKGFSGMTFTAIASSDEEFDAWVQKTKENPDQLNLDTYNELAKPSEYNQVRSYVLTQKDLFDQIIMKYMPMP